MLPSQPTAQAPMERARPRPLVIASLPFVAAALLAVGLAVARTPPPPPSAPPTSRWSAATDAALKETLSRITSLTATSPSSADPQLPTTYAQLGSLYLQKVRETGDPTLYAPAERAFRAALELSPTNVPAVIGTGRLHLARHQFTDAMQWGQLALDRAPYASAAYGVLADSLIELGHYPAAVDVIQRMVDLRPDLTSLSRVSYARELHGDLPGAAEAMRLAIAAGDPRAEATSWAVVQLGHLYFLAGDLDAADSAFTSTLSHLPDYAPGLAGRARVAASRGDLVRAITLYQRAQHVIPLPEYAIALGDLYRELGDHSSAAAQDDLVRVTMQLQRAGGVDVDLELALWELDRVSAEDATALDSTLATITTQHQRRPDNVHTADVLAWALHRTGQSVAALPHARAALRLGTQDPVMLYHAAAIAAAAGSPDEARDYVGRALTFNPRFSPRYAPLARRLLAQLSSPPRPEKE